MDLVEIVETISSSNSKCMSSNSKYLVQIQMHELDIVEIIPIQIQMHELIQFMHEVCI